MGNQNGIYLGVDFYVPDQGKVFPGASGKPKVRNLVKQGRGKMSKKMKFLWCPVCMVHTYHQESEDGWLCVNEDHDQFLQKRTDLWIEKYRASDKMLAVSLKEAEG